ncbi:MAG: putative quinol monooxygenase, partial [Burkholderiales bacterium]
MIHVIAIITAKPGQREKIFEVARANLAAVRAEDGCIEYG